MRMISTGAAAVFLLASACGAFAAPSAQGTKIDSSAILAETTNPQDKTMAPSQKPGSRKSSAHRYRGHRTSMHRASRRHRTSMHPTKRTSTKATKTSRKIQKPS
jgi:hypothetical protein